MKNKFLVTILILLLLIGCLTGCKKTNMFALEFKNDFESLNGQKDKFEEEYRKLTIDKDNPFEKVDSGTILQKIVNNETFYVLFGDETCPWTRSSIEKFVQVAKEKGIKKVYYVDMLDKEGKEIFRSQIGKTEDGKVGIVQKGTDIYYELLKHLDSVLLEYNLLDKDGNKYDINEKRIVTPSYVYFKGGVAIKRVDGISPNQKDSRGELTEEVLYDQEAQFKRFFE